MIAAAAMTRLASTARVCLACLAPPRELLGELLSRGVLTKLRLIEALNLPPHGRVLDVGTGRGILPILLLNARPDLHVVGVDADHAALQWAQRNAVRSRVVPTFTPGQAERLPFASEQFDVVVSTLTLHHLPLVAKSGACREFARVLKPQGACYVADFAPPRGIWARLAAIVPRVTCFRHIGENFRGSIPRLLEQAGFVEVEEVFQTASSVSLHRARLPTACHHTDAAASG